ncbi:MAG: hemerythrin family protein [Gammaproteobacteria bacterium]|nr:hemerythrin family protein [Gammaproteobacteria bacterium]MBL6998928.1 hemerythrin family protein [Gammaproteobacteria bacterium]
MKNLVWDESLSVEVDEIDEDHRRLVDLFNILSHSVTDGDADDYIDAVLEELISCTIWHFRHEERLMIKHQYAGLGEHKAEHQALIDSVRDLQKTFHQVNKLLTSDDIEFLANWLTEHILGQDMKLGFYLMRAM